jgi:hypothetical protein
MSKFLLLLKVLAWVLAGLVITWFAVIFLAALLAEWVGDMKRKHLDTPSTK